VLGRVDRSFIAAAYTMSFVAYICLIAVLNAALGFMLGLRHRAAKASELDGAPLDEVALYHEPDLPEESSSLTSDLADNEPLDEAADSASPAVKQETAETLQTTEVASGPESAAGSSWRVPPKQMDQELERIERNLPMLRGCTDARALQRAVDELTRVTQRQLSTWRGVREELTKSGVIFSNEQQLLDQAIAQAESTLANLAQLTAADDLSATVTELEKELVLIRRIQAVAAGPELHPS
jgi:hypothetical protein